MSFGVALQMAAVKLMNALRGDRATFLTGQGSGDLLPRFAPLALFADEFYERFKAAMKSSAAAGAFATGRLASVDDFLFHQQPV